MSSCACRASSYLVPFVLVLLASPAVAQTPTATVSVATQPTQPADGSRGGEMRARGVSPVNPWLSGSVAYRFPGTGDPGDSFLVTARALYWLDRADEPASPRGWGLPIMGNVSGLSASTPPEDMDRKVQEVASSSEGMYAGVFPYWRFYKQSLLSPTGYVGIVPFKLNFVKAPDGSTQSLYHGDVSAGLELAIGKKDGRSLLTVSASATYAFPYDKSAFSTAFPDAGFHRWSGEVTAVLPIGEGLGLVVSSVFPEGADPGFSAGLLIGAPVGK